jgi:hypothetical protein
MDTPKLNKTLFLNPNTPALDIDIIALGPGEIFDIKT